MSVSIVAADGTLMKIAPSGTASAQDINRSVKTVVDSYLKDVVVEVPAGAWEFSSAYSGYVMYANVNEVRAVDTPVCTLYDEDGEPAQEIKTLFSDINVITEDKRIVLVAPTEVPAGPTFKIKLHSLPNRS